MLKAKQKSDNKIKTLCPACVSQPVPVECAFTAYGQIMAIRLDFIKKIAKIILEYIGMNQFIAFRIHKTHIHLS